jgi:heme-degrading monooxygenase HmoA
LPVIVTYGEKDIYGESQRPARNRFPKAAFVEIENAGHIARRHKNGRTQSDRTTACGGRTRSGLVRPTIGSKEEGERRYMIARIWHGWTTHNNADNYEALLKQEIFVGIQNRRIRGFKNIQLLRREAGEEVEFVTIMLFDSLDSVREFAGENYEAAVVPERARAVLSHFDERSQHYEIRAERRGEG